MNSRYIIWAKEQTSAEGEERFLSIYLSDEIAQEKRRPFILGANKLTRGETEDKPQVPRRE